MNNQFWPGIRSLLVPCCASERSFSGSNYLAENIWPYPEDATVAKWVLNYAEPKGLMSIKDKKPVDESNLLEYTPEKEPEKKIIIKEVNRSKIRIKRPPQNGGD
ncbi:MAG: hypothetical protein R2824_36205 [Saprospiraceae bacterium]